MRKFDQDSSMMNVLKKEISPALEKRRAYEQRLRNLKANGFQLIFNSEEFKARLTLALQFSSKTRKQIDEEKGISSSMISTYLNTSIKPSLDTYLDLCDCLGVSPYWLMGSIPEADIEFGLNPSGHSPFKQLSSYFDQRSFQLAVMLAIHSRHNFKSIYSLFRIVRGLSKRSERQISLLQNVMDSMEDARFTVRTRYSALLTDSSQEEKSESYETLIGLNRVTSAFYDQYISHNVIEDLDSIRDFAMKSLSTSTYSQRGYEYGIPLNQRTIVKKEAQYDLSPTPVKNSKQPQESATKQFNDFDKSDEIRDYFFSKFQSTEDVDLFFQKLPEFLKWDEINHSENIHKNEDLQSSKATKKQSKANLPTE